jgi:catechol 2,3-dioxygenase-like lactoylglutathione lyase family enzyme
MVPQRISLITLGARNLPVLRAFYLSLGWKETKESSDSYAVFLNAGVLLSLFPIEELAKDAGITFSDSNEGFHRIALAINVDKPEEVDEVVKAVAANGARVLKPAIDAFWGGRSAYFADPENNLWEIAWNPTAVFDERGAMISF